MIARIFIELGPWNWWIAGLILLGLEIIAPGTFFLWFGIAAVIVGTLSLAIGSGWEWWTWQIQVLLFVILSLVLVVVGRRFMRAAGDVISDHPDINERGRQLIGRTALLEDPIVQGVGRARVGDTTWRVTGPDLPAGSRVDIVDASSSTLEVVAHDLPTKQPS